jgi:Fic family protein
MLEPKYTITPQILSNITLIERLYGQIEALKIPKNLEINLTRNNMIQSSYASNKIEGNPLSEGEVTNLLLNDRVPTNRDEKEVVNYFKILKSLDKRKNEPITLATITELHKELMTGIDPSAGNIRNVQVVVGRYKKDETGAATLRVKHNPPFHTKEAISEGLGELIAWCQAQPDLPVVIKTGIYHHHFVWLHPFEDGNGRVCRLTTALLFLQSGYEINKYFVLDDYYDIDRDQYSDMLHSADDGDKTQWLGYYSDGVKYSLQSALSRVNNATRTLQYDQKRTPKEHEVMEIIYERKEVTSGDISKALKVTRQQAHNLLKGLVEKGFLNKKGITKRSYYYIK